jgi:hypothetical protein
VSQNFVGTVANEEIAGFQIMAFSDRFSQHGQLDRDKLQRVCGPGHNCR